MQRQIILASASKQRLKIFKTLGFEFEVIPAAFSPAYEAGASLTESIDGSYTGFTYGIPMELVAEYLKKSLV